MFNYSFKEMRLMDALPFDIFSYALDKFKAKMKSITSTNKIKVKIDCKFSKIPISVYNTDKRIQSVFKASVNGIVLNIQVVVYFDIVGDYNNISCSIYNQNDESSSDVAKALGLTFIADCPNLLYCNFSADKLLSSFKIHVPITYGKHIEYEFDYSNKFIARNVVQKVPYDKNNKKEVSEVFKTLRKDLDLSKEHTFVNLMILAMKNEKILKSYGLSSVTLDLNELYKQYLNKYETYKDNFINEIDLDKIINYN